MNATLIFHVCHKSEWTAGMATGAYKGSSQDRADGFIHASDATQVRGSVTKHRAGQDNLLIIALIPDALGETLRWEPSRAGALFPHIYGAITEAAVHSVQDLPMAEDGSHIFPANLGI